MMTSAVGKRPGEHTSAADNKRRRSDSLDADFSATLRCAGCIVLPDDAGVEVDDPRELRRFLSSTCTEPSAVAAVLESAQALFEEDNKLFAALQPMTVLQRGVPETGDSLARVLLNLPQLQTQLACWLLERMPEWATAAQQEEDPSRSVAYLVLGSLRWLDAVVDAHALTQKVLEVMPTCCKPVQQSMVDLLPELVPEADSEEVTSKLMQMTEQNSALLVPVLQAISSMAVSEAGQGHVTDLILQCFQSADVADLPAVLRFLLQQVNPQNAVQIVGHVRSSLPCVDSQDPRLPDVRYGRMPFKLQSYRRTLATEAQCEGGGLGGEAEGGLLEALRTSLQCSQLAADTAFNQIKALTEAKQHGSIDVWLLMLLAGLGTRRCEAVRKLLKKKFAEGHADHAWLTRAIANHPAATGLLFEGYLGLGAWLVQGSQGPSQAAGTHLYALLYAATQACKQSDQYQQELLAALHGHLGSGQAAEVTAALQVLHTLAHTHGQTLLQHVGFIGSLLDCLPSLTQAQMHQVFEVVSELAVVTPTGPSAAAAEKQRQALSEQLESLLHKNMSSSEAQSRRVGIIGTIKLAQRLAACTGDDPQPGRERQAQAERLLQHSFEARHSSPGSFAFLCDELAVVVQAGQLAPALTDWLRNAATEELENFLDDRTPQIPSVQCADGVTMTGASWLDINGHAGQVMLPILRLLASEEVSHRQTLSYLCSVSRLSFMLELKAEGSLEALSGVLGCPLHMPQLEALHQTALLGSSPQQQSLICSALLLAVNWVREVLNAWAHHVQPQGCVGGADLQQSLLVRLQNLCQLEALLAHCLSLLPHHPNPLPPLLPPTLSCMPQPKPPAQVKAKKKCKQAGQAEVGCRTDNQENTDSNSLAGEAAEEAEVVPAATKGISKLAAVQGKLRPLEPQVMLLLGQLPSTALPQAMLAPAAFLLDQLQCSLTAAQARARRPAFLNTASSQDQHTQSGEQQSPEEVWAGARAVLPAIRQLLDASTTACAPSQSSEGSVTLSSSDGGAFPARMEGASQDPTAQLLISGHPAASAALAPLPAAARLMQHGLHCLQHLVSCDWLRQPQHQPLLCDFLCAFAAQPQRDPHPANGEWTASQVVQGCLEACRYFQGLASRSAWPLEQAVAVLQIQAQLLQLAAALPADAALQDSLSQTRTSVSSAANEVLQQGSEGHPPGSPASDGTEVITAGGGGWKGWQGQIGDLLQLWLTWSPEPCQAMLGLVQGPLSQVPALPLSGKKAQEPVAGFPGLCGASLHVWYKAVFQELLQQWAALASQVSQLHKAKWAPTHQEGVDKAMQQLRHCSKVYSALLALNKVHMKRVQMHAQGLRWGCKLIQHCLRTLPFWQAWFSAHPNQAEPFSKALKDLQMGNRILYVICAEGKANKNITIANLVVGTKHALEEFRVGVTAVMLAAQQDIRQGNLKHKDLTGQEVSSQVPFTQVANDDEDLSDAEENRDHDSKQSDDDH